MSKRALDVHERYAHHILTEIEAGRVVSQRSLASELGIALGLTNLLLRRFVRKGWVRMSQVQPKRVGYFLTPHGMAEKARMSRLFLIDSVQYYASARNRLRDRFGHLSAEPRWPQGEAKRVVFLGSGDMAEIAFVCLQETDLQLIGVLDFQGRERFFSVPVHPASSAGPHLWSSLDHESPVVVSFNDTEQTRGYLAQSGFSLDRVFWV